MTLFGVLDRLLAGRLPVNPPDDPYQSILPTPIGNDDFFLTPPGIDDLAPGEVIRRRVTRGLVPRPRTVLHQFMVRSTDARGFPAGVTASLLIPKRPWTGSGPRPVVAHNVAIDSLGATSTPSYRLVHGVGADLPPVMPLWLARGYAVLIADHQGPRMSYSEGTMAGHAVLDAIRGMKVVAEELADSPVVAYGYSGGAIATTWTAQLQPTYAPDVTLAGAVAGGTPTDFSLLLDTMNGTIAAGLLGAASMGLAREHPEMVELFGPKALLLASWVKDMSVLPLALGGLLRMRLEDLTNEPDPFDSAIARRVIEANRPGASAPAAPVAFFHGSASKLIGDRYIPEAGVTTLIDEWRTQGADVHYEPVVGDHFIGAMTGLPFVMRWTAERFAVSGSR
ncbi:lipase family protein [Actinomycetes bacterium M1A6_2h]